MYKTLLFFVLLSASFYAQTNRTIFFGKVFDDLGVLENVHIINLNTNSATKSNFKGEFKIFAKEKDSLKITFVGYKTKVLILKKTDFGINEKQINLKKEIIQLDEVEIKKHTLTGSLESDLKQVPKNKIDELVENAMASIMNMDFGKVIEKIDAIDRMKAPMVNTDPISSFKGVNIFSFSIGGKNKTQLQYAKIHKLEKKRQLPKKIINLIGKKILITEFKIPKERIAHFLDFCSFNNQLENYIQQNNILKLIELLEKESISYLKIINENQ